MDLSTVRNRDRLKPQREPYWHKLAAGEFLGFRPSSVHNGGAWIVRAYDADTQRNRFHALGDFGDVPAHERFGVARKAAQEWIAHVTAGGSTKPITVKQACQRYAEDKPEAAARFARHVHDDPIARVLLPKLTKKHVTAWRERLQRKPVTAPTGRKQARSDASVNRDMTALRASLNAALDHGDVLNDHAWRTALRPIRNADRSRNVYLDRDQRRALIDALPADCAAFARGLCALPLRPGALAGLTVRDFDSRRGTLKIGVDKAGKDRTILLPVATVALLKAQARGKLPAAPLFARASGGAWDRFAWRDPIKAAVRATGLADDVSAYALRHSTITDLIADGVPTLTAAQLSGTSVAMIERHYGHLLQKQAQAALAKLVL